MSCPNKCTPSDDGVHSICSAEDKPERYLADHGHLIEGSAEDYETVIEPALPKTALHAIPDAVAG